MDFSITDSHYQEKLRALLREELLKRCRSNARYSMRAFARSLSVEASELSKILNSKRRISVSMFRKLESRMDMRSALKEKLVPSQFVELPEEHFTLLSEWSHFAILELISTHNFKGDARWIARRLGLPIEEVKQSIDRLQKCGYLKVSPRGKWQDLAGEVSTVHFVGSSQAQRKFQHQMLNKSLVALEEVPLEKRDHSGVTMAISSELVPQAKEMIRKFRRDLCTLLQSKPKRDAVYQLTVSLFPLAPSEN